MHRFSKFLGRIKEQEDDTTKKESKVLKLEDLRAVVTVPELSDCSADGMGNLLPVPVDDVNYIIILSRKDSGNKRVSEVARTWSYCEGVFTFIRSMFRKLGLAKPPSARSMTGTVKKDTVVIEERRKYLENFVNTVTEHPSAAKSKEVRVLCGLVDDTTGANKQEASPVYAAPKSMAGALLAATERSGSRNSSKSASPSITSPRITSPRMSFFDVVKQSMAQKGKPLGGGSTDGGSRAMSPVDSRSSFAASPFTSGKNKYSDAAVSAATSASSKSNVNRSRVEKKANSSLEDRVQNVRANLRSVKRDSLQDPNNTKSSRSGSEKISIGLTPLPGSSSGTGSARGSIASKAAPTPSSVSSPGLRRTPPKCVDDLTPEERKRVDECFRLADADQQTYVMKDTLLNFFLKDLPDKVEAKHVQKAIAEADKNSTDILDAKMFRLFVVRVAQLAQIGICDMLAKFRTARIRELYEAVGNSTMKLCENKIDVDRAELRVLLRVIKTTGLRTFVADDEEFKEVEFSVPYAFAEFCDIMELLTEIFSLDDLFKALKKENKYKETARNQGRVVALMNAAAAKASVTQSKSLKEKIAQYGGATCQACDGFKAQLAALEKKMEEMQNDYAAQIDELEAELDEVHEALEQRDIELAQVDDEVASQNEQVESLKAVLQDAMKLPEQLLVRVHELEEELAAAKDETDGSNAGLASSGDDDDAALDTIVVEGDRGMAISARELHDGHHHGEHHLGLGPPGGGGRSNMQFLLPAHLGSHEQVPAVDKPGALFYEFSDTKQPLAFVTDLFVTDGTVTEYAALRDSQRRRSVCWTLRGGHLTLPWVAASVIIPSGRWVRIKAKIYWDKGAFDVLIDDKLTALRQVPFRDAEASDIATLDVYPRHTAAYCYSNMYFF